MKKLLFIYLVLLVPLAPVCAQDVSWYQVEVIVFDYTEPDLDKELWFENPGWPQHEDAIDIIMELPDPVDSVIPGINQPDPAADVETVPTPAEKRIPYLALPEDNYRLANDYRRLRLSSLYRPLLHVAWQQPGVSAQHIRHVHLERLLNTQVAEVDTETVTDAIGISEPRYEPPKPVFDGLVRLRVPNFLYVDVDFSYFPEDLEAILEQQLLKIGDQYSPLINRAADYVRMQETRRIYLNELNYFDHPLFGVLLQVSRIEQEE